MRKVYLALLLSIIGIIKANAQQWEQTGGPYNYNVNSLSVVDGKTFISAEGTSYRSADHGLSWAGIPTNVGNIVKKGSDLFTIGLWTSGSNMIYRSTDGGATWATVPNSGIGVLPDELTGNDQALLVADEHGVARSTDDGATWSTVLSFGFNYSTALFHNEGRLFAGTLEKIQYSDDDGLTWVDASCPDNSLYIIDFTASGDTVFAVSNLQAIYRSLDNGSTWTKISMNDYIRSAHIQNGKLYAAGQKLYISNDLGNTWYTPDNYLAYTRLTHIEGNGNILLAGSYSAGMFRSDDQGQTWYGINNGIPVTSYSWVYSFSTEHQEPQVLALSSGVDFNCFGQKNNYSEWVPRRKGMINFGQSAVTNIGSTLFAAWNNAFHYSDDLGESWHQVQQPASYSFDYLLGKDSVLIASLDGGGMIVSYDMGQTWTAGQGTPPQPDDAAFALFKGKTHVFGALRTWNNNGDAVALGIYSSDDNGLNWVRSDNGLPLYPYVNDLVQLGDTVFISMMSNIYKSGDNGQSWTMVQGLPNGAADLEVIGNHLFAASGSVYHSPDYGATWTELTTQFDCVSLAFDGKHLLAGSKDKGVWKRELTDLGITSAKDVIAMNDVIIYPNPSNDKFRISGDKINGSTLCIYDASGRCVYNRNADAGEMTIDLSGSSKGVYSLVISSGAKRTVKKLVLY